MCSNFSVSTSQREKKLPYTPEYVCFISRKGCNIVLQTRRTRLSCYLTANSYNKGDTGKLEC